MFDAGYYEDTGRVKRDQAELAKIMKELESHYFDWQKRTEELEKLVV
jgi:hypothetical protein